MGQFLVYKLNMKTSIITLTLLSALLSISYGRKIEDKMWKGIKTLISLAGGNVVVRNIASENVEILINFKDLNNENCLEIQRGPIFLQRRGGQLTAFPSYGCQGDTISANKSSNGNACKPQEFVLRAGRFATIADDGKGNCVIR